jgi:hypothetical protein
MNWIHVGGNLFLDTLRRHFKLGLSLEGCDGVWNGAVESSFVLGVGRN